MNASSLSPVEFVLVYAIPALILIAIWLFASGIVWSIARWTRWPLAEDLRVRVERKRRNRSGASVRLSFGHVVLSMAGDNCFQATVLYRLSSWLEVRRLRPLGRAVHSFSKFLTHVDISPGARIGPGLYLYHGIGTVIGKGSTIGRKALVCQNVTMGGGAAIGDDVTLWAGAKIIGRVYVGDRSEVGANGVVVEDVPPDVIAVGVPAVRFLPRSEAQLAEGNYLQYWFQQP